MGRRAPHALFHNPLHVSQRLLNLRLASNLPGRKLVPAEPTDKVGPKLQLSEPDLEQLLAVRAGNVDPGAPEVLKQAASSRDGMFLRPLKHGSMAIVRLPGY